jgi:phage replication O-like protein O
MTTSDQATFPGFPFPNTTQIPNEVFDTLMSKLSGGELKVLLYICRRTFGFRKDSDRISLAQIAHGITTKAGRVLDQGTGLSKRHVITALKTLEKRKIITVSRTMDETGVHEVNTYSLNLPDADSRVGTKCPQRVVNSSAPEVVNPTSPRVVNCSAPTKQREQKKEEQKKDSDVVTVTKALQNFGITQSVATILTQSYPAQYIREKVVMARRLVAARSGLVSQNPAGWLRRAIEEDYTMPNTAEIYRQRSAKRKQHVKHTQVKNRDQHPPQEESQSARNAATTPCQWPQHVAMYNRDSEREKTETEETNRENQAIWDKALEHVKRDLAIGETSARLAGTALLEVTDTTARIGVANPFAIAWLERRMYGQIASAIKQILGKDLDLQFISSEAGISSAGSFGV